MSVKRLKILIADNEKQNTFIDAIEAIALGVEDRQEMLDIHSEKVVMQTINVARIMAFSEEEIQKWVRIHNDLKSPKIKQFTDSIFKLV